MAGLTGPVVTLGSFLAVRVGREGERGREGREGERERGREGERKREGERGGEREREGERVKERGGIHSFLSAFPRINTYLLP